ncbi:Calcium/calmodulin-dependent 3'5'-cyclic nucleotide phosphodiesterase 1C [Taenia crassiceps]|uniref:Phosphodiesterase n=1 Tax=Taenia crassiceps TaxID=6207 RepID=A0ABR4Q8I0_9CEST
MGSCYSQCKETITPIHLGNAAVSYQQQHQQQQHRRLRVSLQETSNHHEANLERSTIQREQCKGDPAEMRINSEKHRMEIGYPPDCVEKLSTSSAESTDCDEATNEEEVHNVNQSYENEFPSLSNSSLATYAKRTVSVEGLPTPGSTDSTFACLLRLRKIVKMTEENKITKSALIENLTYALQVVQKTYIEETKRLRDEDDELSETACSEVPDEVRDWLATTFTRNPSGSRRVAKPRFRSVVNAIRAGIVVERIYRRMSSCTCLTLPPNVILLLKGGLDEWNFNVFEFNEVSANHALKYVGFELLHKYNLISKFQIDSTRLENLLLRLEIGYSRYRNPYHNLIHASDVAQTCHVILTTSKLRDYLTDLDVFAVIYAALIHDFEHTGTTNNFHIQTQTELAMLYNDRNVLENYHVSAVFRITQESEFNIFENMPKEQYQEFRTAVIDMVLNTDMSLHFSQAKTMKNLIAIPEIIDKLKALSLLVHCADIAHPCKRWDLHRQWSFMLSEEFFRQGNREKELGMPCSPLCDRNTVVLPQSQIGFIDFIVEPIFVVLGDMLDKMMEHTVNAKEEGEESEKGREDSMSQMRQESAESSEGALVPVQRPWVCHLKENKENWSKELKQLEEEKKKLTETDKPTDDGGGNTKGETTEVTEDTNEETEDRLSDRLDSMDFIDCDGEEETEPTS